MKKHILKLLCLVLCLCSLTGCMGYREIDGGYLLTAIGFKAEGDTLHVITEFIVTSDSQDTPPEKKTLSMTGKTPQQALYNLSHSFSKPIYFDHCAAVIIEDSVTPDQIKQIIDYCSKTQNLNLSIYMISSSNVSALLESETAVSAVGYHIMSVMKQHRNESGIDYKNKFYQIRQKTESETNTFSLPIVQAADENIELAGERIYINFNSSFVLDNTESIAYSVLSGRFGSGRVCIDAQYADIKSYKCDFDVSEENSFLKVNAKARIKADDMTDGFLNTLQTRISSLTEKIGKENVYNVFFIKKQTGEGANMPCLIEYSIREE